MTFDSVLVHGGLRVHTVPKVASTSLSAAMPKGVRRAFPTEASDDWRFMVVRHPLDRLVSAWRYFTTDKTAQRVFQHDVQLGMPFPAFLDVVLKDPSKDRHTAPQTRYRGPFPIDDLVRLESLEGAWDGLVGRFAVTPLEHRNATEREKWWNYYHRDMDRRALAVFEADLEMWEDAA